MAEVESTITSNMDNETHDENIPPENVAEAQIDENNSIKAEPDGQKALTTTNRQGDNVIITTNAEGKRVKKIIRKKRRPARPQVDPSTIKSEPPPQTGTIFNIWYNKWSGGDKEDIYLAKHHATSRCHISTDTGYTTADNQPGSFICLFFARGLCPRGRDCEYLHRPPSTFDIYSGNVDCFGRDKHSDYRDDMGGVGTFSRQNRTLYVGRIHPTDDIEEIVARHFAEWGNIERIRVLPARGVAFVTYVTESLAQFAKEAMAHQSLDHEEILNVRWATVDPNPASQKREARKIEEQAADAIRRALPEAFVKEMEGDPETKRRRLDEGNFGLEGYRASDDVWFARDRKRMAVEDGRAVGGQNGVLEAPERRLLIGHGSTEDDVGQQQGQEEEEQRGNLGGLLGSSTLAALDNYKPNHGGATFATEPPGATSGGPLVGYGSDDDSDDDSD